MQEARTKGSVLPVSLFRRCVQFLCVSMVFVGVAYADTTIYTTNLSGAAEAPPNESPGTGTATVTVDTEAHTLEVDATFSGLVGTTTAAHIHCCTAVPFEGTAGVATTLPNFEGFPLGVRGGTYLNTLNLTDASSFNPAFVTARGGTLAGAEAALLAALAEGRAYFNIHSTTNPGGEIRGFLAATSQEVMTGFVVITPNLPAAGQHMVASATFGSRSSCGPTQAGAQAARPSTSGIIPISSNTALNRNLGVAIVNLSDTEANVTFSLHEIDGSEVATVAVPFGPLTHRSFYVSQLFSADPAGTAALRNFLGTLTYRSNVPVAVMGLRFQGENLSTVPAAVTSEAALDVPTIRDGVGGPGALVLPHFAAGGGWDTQITVTNSSISQPQLFRVDLFDKEGNPLSIGLNGQTGSSFTNLQAPVNGALFLTTGAPGASPF